MVGAGGFEPPPPLRPRRGRDVVSATRNSLYFIKLACDHLQVESSPLVDPVAVDFLSVQPGLFEYN
jgi:hypothetical protein